MWNTNPEKKNQKIPQGYRFSTQKVEDIASPEKYDSKKKKTR